jgi:hypothetical protein
MSKGGYGSEYELQYRGKNFDVGESWDIRILSLDEDFVQKHVARAVSIRNPRNDEMMTGIIVPDPGEPHNRRLKDHAGVLLCDCDEKELHRIPIFVYRHTKKESVEEINKLMYLEFTAGLRISIQALEEAHKGQGAFDEESARPEYDILLSIAYNNPTIRKKYTLEPIFMDDDGNRHPHRGVPAEKVLKDLGYAEAVFNEWDKLQEEMAKGLDLKAVEARLAIKGDDDDEDDDTPKKKSASARGKTAKAKAEPEPEEEEACPFDVGDRVKVNYDGDEFLGKVEEVDEENEALTVLFDDGDKDDSVSFDDAEAYVEAPSRR